MDAFLSSHLLDGTLGRGLAFIAIAILAGLYLWQWHFTVRIPSVKKWVGASVFSGITGAALSLNSTFFQLSESFNEGESLSMAWENTLPLLLDTSYGLGWLIFCGLLVLSWFSVTYPRWMLVNLAALIASLSLNGHAAEDGIFSLVFVLDVIHLACVMAWLGGLLFIVLARFTSLWSLQQPHLQAFSKFILPVFLCAQVSGILRLTGEYLKSGELGLAYISVAFTKILLVISIGVCAAGLRKTLRQKVFNGTRYDDLLGVEFFCAIVLLLAAAMLTQLPPI